MRLKLCHVWIGFFCLGMLLTSCEGIAGGKGTVIATDTKKPVGDAGVVLLFNDQAIDTTTTDTTGWFTAQKEFKSLFYRPDAKLIVSKSGYKPVTVPVTQLWYKDPDFDKEHITIYLEPLGPSTENVGK